MQEFSDRNTASQHIALMIKQTLLSKLKQQDRATLVMSGGSSPVECFRILSSIGIPWHRVDVTLTDERNVPVNHTESNERSLRDNLIRGKASAAQFVRLEEGIGARQPFACCLVGMGEDGHFASLFPDSPELEEGLSSEGDVIQVSTPSSPYQRTSMTLETIKGSDEIILLVFGEKKREILNNPEGFAINHLLQSALVKTVWAP